MTTPTASQPPEDLEPRDLPQVTVSLLGSTREVRGMDLPEGLHAESVGGADLLQPHLLTVRLPDGRPLTLAARSMSLLSRNGVVTDVYVRRPMHPERFKEAVADLRRTLETLKIEPNQRMTEEMATWPVDAPGMDEEGAYSIFKMVVEIAPSVVDLDIHVRPDPDGGWFYLIMFGATVEARRAAYEAAKTAGPQSTVSAPSGRGVAPTVVSSPDFSRVTVRLGGATGEARGVEIPATRPGGPASTAEVAHPHALTIELPGGRRPLFLLARSSTFSSRDGLVDRISIHRPMLPLPYERAISDLLDTVKALGIDPKKVGSRLKAQLDSPKTQKISAEFPDAVDGIDLGIKIELVPGGDWSYSLEFIIRAPKKGT